jgi:hypothetical protein
MWIQKGIPLTASAGTDLVIEDLSDDVSSCAVTGFCSTAADYVIRASRADGES